MLGSERPWGVIASSSGSKIYAEGPGAAEELPLDVCRRALELYVTTRGALDRPSDDAGKLAALEGLAARYRVQFLENRPTGTPGWHVTVPVSTGLQLG